MINVICFVFFVLGAEAKELAAMKIAYDFESKTEYQTILNKIKSFGDFTQKESSEITSPNQPPKLSRGQQMVEDAKAKNRAILAQRKAESSESKKDDLSVWKKEVKKTHETWKNETKNLLDQWKKEQAIFLGRMKMYKENTFEFPIKEVKIVEKKITKSNLPSVSIVPGAFDIPVKDQEDRATCSAFAGIRAMEIILKQNQMNMDLSEQYFYWASKPNCQNKPCQEKGSWIPLGLKHSQIQKTVDIPLEETCSYSTDYDEENETQVPLDSNCRLGKIKVSTFKEVSTLHDMVEEIKLGRPVIMAAKLSENFYQNQGLVRLHENSTTGEVKMDSHSKGHAMLAVGVVELPESLKASEGDFCLIVTNSWGEGWGAGGHGCLTENWLKKFRQKAPFFSITGINI